MAQRVYLHSHRKYRARCAVLMGLERKRMDLELLTIGIILDMWMEKSNDILLCSIMAETHKNFAEWVTLWEHLKNG